MMRGAVRIRASALRSKRLPTGGVRGRFERSAKSVKSVRLIVCVRLGERLRSRAAAWFDRDSAPTPNRSASTWRSRAVRWCKASLRMVACSSSRSGRSGSAASGSATRVAVSRRRRAPARRERSGRLRQRAPRRPRRAGGRSLRRAPPASGPAAGGGAQLRLRLVERPASLDDLLGQPDQAALLGERVTNGPSDAESRVGLERGTSTWVVLIDRLQEPECAFL